MKPNTRVQVTIHNPASLDSRDDGYVNLIVEDTISGVILVDVEIPGGRWHRLQLGASQAHEAFVSEHLDRVGKQLQTQLVSLGNAWTRDDPPTDRDLFRVVTTTLPEFWHDYEDHSIRRTNKGYEGVIRKWVTPA